MGKTTHTHTSTPFFSPHPVSYLHVKWGEDFWGVFFIIYVPVIDLLKYTINRVLQFISTTPESKGGAANLHGVFEGLIPIPRK